MKNYLTIDVEDWFHFIGSKYTPPVKSWGSLEPHVERMTENILKSIYPYKATFFCLGWVAKRYPRLIRKIVEDGHAVASHGMHHELVFSLGEKRFREDIQESKGILEDCAGEAVTAYRAPGFSVRPQDKWFFEALYEEGYVVDSSVFPAMRTLGGIPQAPNEPHAITLSSGTLWEFPVSTVRLGTKRVAFCGGGFFRFFPYWFIRREINRLNKKGKPAVVYLHPRDIDHLQPRMRLEVVNDFMYHYGLRVSHSKLKMLIRDFEWAPLPSTNSFLG